MRLPATVFTLHPLPTVRSPTNRSHGASSRVRCRKMSVELTVLVLLVCLATCGEGFVSGQRDQQTRAPLPFDESRQRRKCEFCSGPIPKDWRVCDEVKTDGALIHIEPPGWAHKRCQDAGEMRPNRRLAQTAAAIAARLARRAAGPLPPAKKAKMEPSLPPPPGQSLLDACDAVRDCLHISVAPFSLFVALSLFVVF